MAVDRHLGSRTFIYVVLYVVHMVANTRAVNRDSLTCDGGHSPKYLSRDPYGNQMCKQCSQCPPGTGVNVDCEGSRDTECEPCPDGTYSGTWSTTRICQSCRICSPHQRTIRECIKTKNAKCATDCDIGYYLNPLTDNCDPCSWCFTDHPELAPPRAADCMRTVIPMEYQCMQSSHEYRPFVFDPYTESNTPPSEDEFSVHGVTPPAEESDNTDNMESNFLEKSEKTTEMKHTVRIRSTKQILLENGYLPTCTSQDQSTQLYENSPGNIITPTPTYYPGRVGKTDKITHTSIIIIISIIVAAFTILVMIVIVKLVCNKRKSRKDSESLLGKFTEHNHETNVRDRHDTEMNNNNAENMGAKQTHVRYSERGNNTTTYAQKHGVIHVKIQNHSMSSSEVPCDKRSFSRGKGSLQRNVSTCSDSGCEDHTRVQTSSRETIGNDGDSSYVVVTNGGEPSQKEADDDEVLVDSRRSSSSFDSGTEEDFQMGSLDDHIIESEKYVLHDNVNIV